MCGGPNVPPDVEMYDYTSSNTELCKTLNGLSCTTSTGSTQCGCEPVIVPGTCEVGSDIQSELYTRESLRLYVVCMY
jgi:hypothetical protein